MTLLREGLGFSFVLGFMRFGFSTLGLVVYGHEPLCATKALNLISPHDTLKSDYPVSSSLGPARESLVPRLCVKRRWGHMFLTLLRHRPAHGVFSSRFCYGLSLCQVARP